MDSISQPKNSGTVREYLVSMYQALRSGALAVLVLRVTADAPIEWVKKHANEIASRAVADRANTGALDLPVVALYVEPALET